MGAMNVGPLRPCPARGVLAMAGVGVECCPPRWGWSGLGAARGVVPRVAAAAAMRHFHPAESNAGGVSWHGGSSSLHQSQLTFL